MNRASRILTCEGILRKGAALRGLDVGTPTVRCPSRTRGCPVVLGPVEVYEAHPRRSGRRDAILSAQWNQPGHSNPPLPGTGQGPKVGCAPARRSLRADVNAPAIKALRTARNSGAFPANHRVRSRGIQASARNSGERGERT